MTHQAQIEKPREHFKTWNEIKMKQKNIVYLDQQISERDRGDGSVKTIGSGI